MSILLNLIGPIKVARCLSDLLGISPLLLVSVLMFGQRSVKAQDFRRQLQDIDNSNKNYVRYAFNRQIKVPLSTAKKCYRPDIFLSNIFFCVGDSLQLQAVGVMPGSFFVETGREYFSPDSVLNSSVGRCSPGDLSKRTTIGKSSYFATWGGTTESDGTWCQIHGGNAHVKKNGAIFLHWVNGSGNSEFKYECFLEEMLCYGKTGEGTSWSGGRPHVNMRPFSDQKYSSRWPLEISVVPLRELRISEIMDSWSY